MFPQRRKSLLCLYVTILADIYFLKQLVPDPILKESNLSVWSEALASSSFFFYKALLVILEKEMVAHSSVLAWKIPWTEEPCELQSMGSQGIGYN